MKICKWCDKEYVANGRNLNVCSTCGSKAPLRPKFVAARDALRERCGLKPMGFVEEKWW